jgi:hypothetical protein
MKFFALLSVAVVVCVDATAILNTGSSVVQRSDDGHGNYAFAYKEQHASGGTSRSEKGGPGYQTGSYTLNDHDGRQRIVQYVADAHGFRAAIKTNEPGVDSKEDPADVSINGGGKLLAVAEPVLAVAEPGLGLGLARGGLGYGVARGIGYGIAAPEVYGYGGIGPIGSYAVKVNHVSGPELGYGIGKVGLLGAPLGLGLGYGKY